MEAPGKTPISFLQEVCVKRGVTPAYELVANEGPVHEPLFVFQCQAGAATASGRGTSKKKAKHNAALAVLQRMLSSGVLTEAEQLFVAQLRGLDGNKSQLDGEANVSRDGVLMSGGGKSKQSHDDSDEGTNPVGSLQELCQRSLWPQPSYEFTCDDGPVHTRLFTCTVRLWRWTEEAIGKSKKLAKRRVASKMLSRISGEKLTIPQEELEQLEEAHIPLLEKHTGAAGREPRIQPLSVKASREIGRFYSGLKTRGGDSINRLPALRTALAEDQDNCILLEQVATKHQFSVTYAALEQRAQSGAHQVLLQLGTLPVAVVHGSNLDSEALARQQAAYNALHYLMLMTSSAQAANQERDNGSIDDGVDKSAAVAELSVSVED